MPGPPLERSDQRRQRSLQLQQRSRRWSFRRCTAPSNARPCRSVQARCNGAPFFDVEGSDREPRRPVAADLSDTRCQRRSIAGPKTWQKTCTTQEPALLGDPSGPRHRNVRNRAGALKHRRVEWPGSIGIDATLNTLRQHGPIDGGKKSVLSIASGISRESTEAFWQQMEGNDVLARQPALS